MNHDFERRVGIWPAGFDADGELFCNQRYGDWPMTVEGDPWRDPAWMLLSAGKKATASSFTEGHEPEKATEENVQTWWRASTTDRTEWLQIDLTGSIDGKDWFVIEDKSHAQTDLSHDLILREEGIRVRFLRLSDMAVPYGQQPCISGLRVFGLGQGEKPAAPDLDMTVSVQSQENTLGYNILFGSSPDKLYHSYMTFKAGDQRIGALIKGRDYFVRVDAFNENGITEGTCVQL